MLVLVLVLDLFDSPEIVDSRCELWHAGALSIRLGWFDVELYPTSGLT